VSLGDLGSLGCSDGFLESNAGVVFVDGSVGADAGVDVNAETACFSSR
jgi:hypothetical protein